MHRSGVFSYGGPGEYEGMEQMEFHMRTGELTTIRTSPDRVAPAEIEANVNLKDPRISVIKHAKKPGYWASGPWASSIEGGEVLGWHKTKKEGVEDVARRLAIHDWHES
jgi:hypothetical protein